MSVENQNKAICEILDEMKAFLCAKNISYDGSAFRSIQYAGKVMTPEDTINVRIVDKLRRLQSSNPEFDGEDTEKDLLGYLIIKMAVKKMPAV